MIENIIVGLFFILSVAVFLLALFYSKVSKYKKKLLFLSFVLLLLTSIISICFVSINQ